MTSILDLVAADLLSPIILRYVPGVLAALAHWELDFAQAVTKRTPFQSDYWPSA